MTEQYDAAKKNRTADPILLKYYSLARLGRPADADAYLRAASARFRGGFADHALLLSALGTRMDGYTPGDTNDEELRRARFFGALEQIKKGDRKHARSLLQSAIDEAPADSFMALVAQIELERLQTTDAPTK